VTHFNDSARKPVLLTAFGLLTRDNLQIFVPFNQSSDSHKLTRRQADPGGVTDDQRNNAYGDLFSGSSTFSSVHPFTHFLCSWSRKRRTRDAPIPGWFLFLFDTFS